MRERNIRFTKRAITRCCSVEIFWRPKYLLTWLMAPVVFLEILFVERHLFFGRELLVGFRLRFGRSRSLGVGLGVLIEFVLGNCVLVGLSITHGGNVRRKAALCHV